MTSLYWVFGQDDVTMMGDEEHQTVRANVLFELGLFMGHMGKGRAFWLSPNGFKTLHSPSDWEALYISRTMNPRWSILNPF